MAIVFVTGPYRCDAGWSPSGLTAAIEFGWLPLSVFGARAMSG